jgi:glycosyltransferase involved in cell wall biosynthesis
VADRPTISVIIPTRDRPLFLAEALRSVLAQHLRPDQIIVVDDGGAGDAGRVVTGVWGRACPPVMVIEEPNRGPGAARNAGLRAAKGELVAFLDDDDLWRPGKLARQTRWFAARPSLGVLGTGCMAWGVARRTGLPQESCSTPMPRSARAGIRCIPLAAMVRANRLVMSSVMARRERLEECGWFDESLPLAQDWDLWLRLAQRTEVAMLAEPLVYYRRHGDQRSAAVMAMRSWEGEVLRRTLARGLPPRLHGVARRRLAWSHVRLGRLLARAGETELAREELGEAMALWRCNPAAWAGVMRCALDRRTLARART